MVSVLKLKAEASAATDNQQHKDEKHQPPVIAEYAFNTINQTLGGIIVFMTFFTHITSSPPIFRILIYRICRISLQCIGLLSH